MELFSKMLELVEENGGTFSGGNSWNTIRFSQPNHKQDAEKVYNQLVELGLNVYKLKQYDDMSMFNHQ